MESCVFRVSDCSTVAVDFTFLEVEPCCVKAHSEVEGWRWRHTFETGEAFVIKLVNGYILRGQAASWKWFTELNLIEVGIVLEEKVFYLELKEDGLVAAPLEITDWLVLAFANFTRPIILQQYPVSIGRTFIFRVYILIRLLRVHFISRSILRRPLLPHLDIPRVVNTLWVCFARISEWYLQSTDELMGFFRRMHCHPQLVKLFKLSERVDHLWFKLAIGTV